MSQIKKVPMILQMEAVECGAASLAMILAYFGKWVPLERLRIDCGVSRDGSNARSILRAARGYDLEANAYKVEPEDLEDMTPCICHWNFEHFLVFRGFKGGYAYLNDPGIGQVKVPREEFEKSFTGIAMEFEKTEKFQPGGQKASMKEYFKKQLSGAKQILLITILLGAFAAFVKIGTPLFTQIFADHILSWEHKNWMATLLGLMTAVAIFSFMQVLLNQFFSRKAGGALSMNANTRFVNHVLRLPMEFFSQRNVGDLLQRLTLNETITNTLVNVLSPMIINIGLIILYTALMLLYSVPLTFIGILAALLNIALLLYLSDLRVNQTRSMQQSQGKYYGATVSCIDNMESIKAAGAERGFFEYWSGLYAHQFNVGVRIHRQNAVLALLPFLLNSITSASVLIIGAKYILEGQLTVGMLLAFQGYMAAFMDPVTSVMTGSQTLIEMRSQMERIEDVMKYPEDKKEDISVEEIEGDGKLSGDVELKNITFGYNPFDAPLITDFSMHLRPGQTVAFVGSSGCGKSTLARLISGLYKPWQGEILFDGKPISKVPKDVFTNSVAVIDQNVVLFDDTVAQNVKMWDKSIEDFTMILACNDAQIRDDLMLRPEGFDTKIVKGGGNFSGGQKQRIEIATALAKEPTVIILDEATSALDPTTEVKVMEAVRKTGATLIIIAHRLSTIRDADEIIVMDKGIVKQRGTHEQLIQQEGLYSDLMQNI